MNPVLDAWNAADTFEASQAMLACCGAQRWADQMVAFRPISNIVMLSEAADQVWAAMGESDWLEAFARHPRIGERKAPSASEQSSSWSQQEQSGTTIATQSTLRQIAEGNALYEQRFGFTFIVCATGKSAEEMLAILRRRLANTRVAELREAAEQQRQIMQIRLGKWLVS
jgi:OHCU decarboxylase